MSETTADNQQAKRGFGRKALLIVIMAVAGIVLAYAIYNIASITAEDSANEHTMEAMRQFVRSSDLQVGGDVTIPADERTIDFAALEQINPEIVGWLYIPGTNVDYPVTQTDNDDFYLTHGPDLEANRAGSLFFEAACSAELQDRNTIIYGHRMNNGSMFGSLSDFEDASYFDEHRTVYLYTADGVRHEYQLYTIFHSSDSMDAPAYKIGYDDASQFISTCEQLKADSIVPVEGVTFTSADKILTLSTCIRGDGASRLVLQALQVS